MKANITFFYLDTIFTNFINVFYNNDICIKFVNDQSLLENQFQQRSLISFCNIFNFIILKFSKMVLNNFKDNLNVFYSI